MRALRVGLAMGIADVVAAAGAGAAGAKVPVTRVIVGSPLTAVFAPSQFHSVGTAANTVLGEAGAHLTSPVTGIVVAWRIVDPAGGPFTLRLLTPALGGEWTGGASSTAVTSTHTGVVTFKTHLPIQAGQLVALDNSNASDKVGVIQKNGSSFEGWVRPLPRNATSAPTAGPFPGEVGFDAIVVPRPSVTSITPSSGSAGTIVTIRGHNLGGASSVHFGSLRASAQVISATKIKTTAPAAAKPRTVGVTVTAPGGDSPISGSDRYTFT